MTIYRFLPATR